MTKKETLEKCHHMWQWLADNPAAEKSDYFKNHGITDHERPKAGCYACEFVERTKDCADCPCLKLWTADNDSKEPHAACAYSPSPYAHWKIAENNLEARTKYAQQIADFCREEAAKC